MHIPLDLRNVGILLYDVAELFWGYPKLPLILLPKVGEKKI